MSRCSPETRGLSWLTLCALLFTATIGVEAAHRYVVGSSADVAPNAVRYTNIGSSSSTNGYVLTSDGSNNSAWVANPGTSDLPLAGGTMTGTINSQSIIPNTGNTYNLGDSTTRGFGIVYANSYQPSNGGLLEINGSAGINLIPSGVDGASDDVIINNSGHLHGSGDVRGQATTSASTSVAVTFAKHMGITPVGVEITPLSDPTAAGVYWVSGISTTGFTINTKIASTLTFSWIVIE